MGGGCRAEGNVMWVRRAEGKGRDAVCVRDRASGDEALGLLSTPKTL